MPLLRADMHDAPSVAEAMNLWHDANVREKLQRVGVIGGYYRATDVGERVLVECELVFRDGGKVQYRRYHRKSRGFPTAIDLVKARLKLKL